MTGTTLPNYRKILVIGPGLTQTSYTVLGGFINRGAYIRGGGGGGLLAELKIRFETSHGSVDRNTFLS